MRVVLRRRLEALRFLWLLDKRCGAPSAMGGPPPTARHPLHAVVPFEHLSTRPQAQEHPRAGAPGPLTAVPRGLLGGAARNRGRNRGAQGV